MHDKNNYLHFLFSIVKLCDSRTNMYRTIYNCCKRTQLYRNVSGWAHYGWFRRVMSHNTGTKLVSLISAHLSNERDFLTMNILKQASVSTIHAKMLV